MNCLVLGGGGFLGSHLSEALIKRGCAVRILEKSGFSRNNISSFSNLIEVVEGDWREPGVIKAALKDIEVVYHLIGTAVPAISDKDPEHDIVNNVLPTLELLEELRKHPVRKLVFFSSGGTVYGIPQHLPIDEDHPTNPICSYGTHKLTIEKYLNVYGHLHGLNHITLRIANVYGERQSPFSGQGAVAVFIHKTLRHEPITIWGDGSAVRDYIHVSDVISAALHCIDYEGPQNIFNIGSGTGSSLLELLQTIEDFTGLKADVHFSPSRLLDVSVNVLDISRAKDELQWTPKVEFIMGIEITVKHCLEVSYAQINKP